MVDGGRRWKQGSYAVWYGMESGGKQGRGTTRPSVLVGLSACLTLN
jgi:hypothetical protein